MSRAFSHYVGVGFQSCRIQLSTRVLQGATAYLTSQPSYPATQYPLIRLVSDLLASDYPKRLSKMLNDSQESSRPTVSASYRKHAPQRSKEEITLEKRLDVSFFRGYFVFG